MKQFKFSLFILATTLVLGLSNSALSQSNSEPGDFKITVGYENQQLNLHCEYGCAWTELNFSLGQSSKPQFINEMGMTSKADEQTARTDLAHFLFSFTRIENKISCESVFGTNWDLLEFSCPEATCNAEIDKSGVFVRN